MKQQNQENLPNTDRDLSAAGILLSGYGLLRLSPDRWRDLIGRLVAPATRLHDLRNVRTRMWREALCELDSPCN